MIDQKLKEENEKLKAKVAELENDLLAMQLQSNDFIRSLNTRAYQFQHMVNKISKGRKTKGEK